MRDNHRLRGMAFDLLVAAFLTLGSCAALADGRPLARPSPPPAAARWDGLYLGANAGTVRASTDWHYVNDNYFNTLGPVLVGSDFELDGRAGTGGGHIGFNHQVGPWVLGIEGSLSLVRFEETIASPLFPTLDVYQVKIDRLATLAGRIGYARDWWLLYGKAGWAWADVDLSLRDHVNLIDAGASRRLDGWTVGAGFEYAIRSAISVGIAYDYVRVDAESWTVGCPLCGTGVGFGTPIVDAEIALHAVTARLSYRLGD